MNMGYKCAINTVHK